MGDIGSLASDRHEVFLHLLDEAIDRGAELLFFRLEVSTLIGGAVAVKNLTVSVCIRMRHDGLVYVEQHPDLSLLNTLVILLLPGGELFVVGCGYHFFRVMPVDIVVPRIPVERHSLLLADDRYAGGLGGVEEHILRRRKLSAVGEKLEYKRIERTDPWPFGIYPGSRHTCMVEPCATVAPGVAQSLVYQLDLADCRLLFLW